MYHILVVEDEPLARSYITESLKAIVDSDCKIRSTNSIETAYEFIKDQAPDILFLDINLENRSGLELLAMTQPYSFHVIFTTAHAEYAIEAFKHGALDFLHKPFDQDQLEKSLSKAIRRIQDSNSSKSDNFLLKRPKNLIVPSTEGHIIVQQSKIQYCEADSNYTKIYYGIDSYILTSKNLGEIEKLLDQNIFYRLHQSFVINTSIVVRITKNRPYKAELTSGLLIPVSERRRTDFIDFLSNLRV